MPRKGEEPDFWRRCGRHGKEEMVRMSRIYQTDKQGPEENQDSEDSDNSQIFPCPAGFSVKLGHEGLIPLG